MRVAALLILAACGGKPPAPPTHPPSGPTDEKFTGTITAANFGCAADASCDLVIDQTKTVHFGGDTRTSGPVDIGDVESLWPLMEQADHGVGKRVEVFAATTDHQRYTVFGKQTYYIKVLP